jgi:hypothetical protein
VAYTQPDIRAAVDQLRRINGRSSNVPVPTTQRTSESSLVRRLEAAPGVSEVSHGVVPNAASVLGFAAGHTAQSRVETSASDLCAPQNDRLADVRRW